VSEDERAIRERLAALESEVKAEGTAQKARKEAALQLVQAERAVRAERAAKAAAAAEAARPKPVAKVAKPAPKAAIPDDDDSILEELASSALRSQGADRKARGRVGLGSALELARRAQDVKAELGAPRKKGQKSWMVSAGASTLFGPLGWLYAGSWREAAPASAVWLAGMYLVNLILPFILLMPALMIALPLSGIAGALYALGYNRAGSRQRLFGEDKPKPKALKPSDED
jgi:hypothetical protein